MGITVYDPQAGTDAYSSSRRSATIHFTLTKLTSWHNFVKSHIFHVKGFPWCISLSPNCYKDPYLTVVLSCEFKSNCCWECEGSYKWVTENVGNDAGQTVENISTFSFDNKFLPESRARVYVPSTMVDEVTIVLYMEVNYQNCTWSNHEVKMALDDIARCNKKIATNSEKLLEQLVAQAHPEAAKTLVLEEKVKYLEERIKHMQCTSKPSPVNHKILEDSSDSSIMGECAAKNAIESATANEQLEKDIKYSQEYKNSADERRLMKNTSEHTLVLSNQQNTPTSELVKTNKELKGRLIEHEVELYAHKQANLKLIERLKEIALELANSRDEVAEVHQRNQSS